MKKSLPVNKIAKTSTDSLEITKRDEWCASITEEALAFAPEKGAWRKRLIYTLFKYYSDPDALLIEDFLWDYKITRDTFDAWCADNPDLKKAKEQIKIFIGAKRRKRAMLFDLQMQAAFRDMHCYDPEWGPKVDKHHAELKNMENTGQTPPKTLILKAVEKTEEMDKFLQDKEKNERM